MSFSGTGDYFFGYVPPEFNGPGIGLHSGLNYGAPPLSTLTVDGGTYTRANGQYLFTLHVGANFESAPDRTGILTLAGGTTIEVATNKDPSIPYYGSVFVGANSTGGAGATGKLYITEGSSLAVFNNPVVDPGTGYFLGGYNNIRIGVGTGAEGYVVVTGAGSTLAAYGGVPRIVVGRDGGLGELRVENGGFVGTMGLDLGRNATGTPLVSTGRLIIDGPGSEVVSRAGSFDADDPRSGGFGYYSPALPDWNGSVNIGRGDGGRGYLTIQNGGLLLAENSDGLSDNPFVRFGRDNGSYGQGLITGAGSALRIVQHGSVGANYAYYTNLMIGEGGRGHVTVTDGAAIELFGDGVRLSVAQGQYSGGVPDTDPAPSVLEISGGATVTLDSQGYGHEGGSRVVVGFRRGANGEISVDGAGSALRVLTGTDFAGDYQSAEIVVGHRGSGRLVVSNGGTVEARELHVGFSAITINPDGTTTTSTDFLADVDAAGSGEVTISGGGKVTITGGDYTPYRGVRIGQASGTVGVVTVDGAGSVLTSRGGPNSGAGVLRAGIYGDGTLNVTGGGLANGNFVEIGRGQGSRGRILVDGAGSRMVVSDEFGNLPGTPDGAYVPLGISGFLRIGRNAGSDGYLGVTNGGVVEVSNDPAGTYDGPAVQIARHNGAYGRAVIDGPGSQLLVAQSGPVGPDYFAGPSITVGDGGQGVLEVRNGASVSVLGDDAFLSVADGRYTDGVPDNTTSQSILRITGGGTVTVDSLGYGFDRGAFVAVGNGPGTNGLISVDGSGSALRVLTSSAYAGDNLSGTISVGVLGTGRLEVTNGGLVEARFVELGRGGAGSGELFVSGTDSELNLSSDIPDASEAGTYSAGLTIGREGTGVLAVESGARIAIDGTDDRFPFFGLGYLAGGSGQATVDGPGSEIVLNGTRTDAPGEGGHIAVGRAGSGTLAITGGGRVSNSPVNSLTSVGREEGSAGAVTVDGSGSLLDAGTRLLIGAGFDFTTGAVLGSGGGTGSVSLSNGGAVSAIDVYVGAGGSLTGSGVVSGDVELLSGTLSPGDSPGSLLIDGDFTADETSTVRLDVEGFDPGQFDTLSVTGAATIDLRALDIVAPSAAVFPAGSAASLIMAGSLQITNLSTENLLLGEFGSVPVEGATTLNGRQQAFLVADTGADLVIQALGSDGERATGAADFGTGVPNGIDVETINGFGVGTGGGFDAFALLGVSAILGTGGSDVIRMFATSGTSIEGRTGDDILVSGSGDDRLAGGAGDDEIDGGAGTDTAVFAGNAADYTVETVEGITTVRDDNLADGDDGLDTLANIEILRFADRDITGDSNTDPAAADDLYGVDEGGTRTVRAVGGVLANDSDADGDPLSATLVSGPSNGTLTLNPDGSFTYTPAPGFAGTDSFTYVASDGRGGTSAPATVTIRVRPVNEDPAAAHDRYGASSQALLTIGAADGVLRNDADPDGDSLTVAAVNGSSGAVGTAIALASGALLTLNSNGSFVYDPNGEFTDLGVGEVAIDSFRYTVADGNGGAAEAIGIIRVGATDKLGSIAGGVASDRLIVTGPSDFLANGGSGDDLIMTGSGDDIIVGGLGNDTIRPGLGADRIIMGLDVSAPVAGRDLLIGTIEELDGDTIVDLRTNDRIGVIDGMGNPLAATFSVASGTIRIDVGSDGRIDAVLFSESSASGSGTAYAGANPFARLADVPIGETLAGTSLDDVLSGTNAADRLSGADGDDHLFGNEGDDFVDGGSGTDRMLGGGGADTFIFRAGNDVDLVYDFEIGSDRIEFAGFAASDVSIRPYSLDSTEIGAIGGDRLVLVGIDPSELTSDHFQF